MIAENPNKKGMLFAGTGNALYYSMDDGEAWKQLQGGLPPAPVSWIVVQKQTHDLVVSTYGRGFYIMEDITPLEQGVMETAGGGRDREARGAAPAYRKVQGGRALVNFWLKEPPRARSNSKSRRQGRAGAQTARRHGPGGLNRVAWDMHYDPPRWSRCAPRRRKIRTSGKSRAFRIQDTRPITHWGVAQAEVGPIAAPGVTR